MSTTTSNDNQSNSNMVTQNVFQFTSNNSQVTRDTFPDKTTLVTMITQDQFNRLLQVIKTKIINASILNLEFIRILNTETTQFKAATITCVKTFLSNKSYSITEIEDATGQSTGWKLGW